MFRDFGREKPRNKGKEKGKKAKGKSEEAALRAFFYVRIFPEKVR
jgi:hypothetical protein